MPTLWLWTLTTSTGQPSRLTLGVCVPRLPLRNYSRRLTSVRYCAQTVTA
ncbi:hypothetical protein sh1_0013 [Citrobacter phage SH1]|uniref:Uncharacterized protein n=1 Tax=Citrobacter phage SH1 TaxID=1805464 RepID=A0A172JFX9_9CAUD|nr:hypothetical protein BI011_gp13 [Citrobacter phage SH1]AMR59413.1 hypothetical protein sh1_0013 [Citrobacter phage SH1]